MFLIIAAAECRTGDRSIIKLSHEKVCAKENVTLAHELIFQELFFSANVYYV